MRANLVLAFLLAASPAAFGLEAGGTLPALSAPKLGEPQQSLPLQSLKGRVVYVDFWASWCVPCRLSMPKLDALQKKHAARGLTVVGVNKDTSYADASRFLKRVPVGFTLLQDEKDAIARAFDVKTMPSGYLIDRKGVVRKVHRGFTDETATALEKEIEDLLKEPG